MSKLLDARCGFISLDEVEKKLIDSTPLFRLRQIHQLGMSNLFYPGATHNRFEHALGVMHAASEIYDHLTLKSAIEGTPKPASAEHAYWRSVVRSAALLHDVGHLPFSHAAEKTLLKEGHEAMGALIVESDEIKTIVGPMLKDVLKIAFVPDKEKWAAYTPWEKAVALMIVGDCFGADRIDYLLRDSAATGVRYGFFDEKHLIEKLTFVEHEGKVLIAVKEGALDAISALLLSRHFMYRRVYRHPAVQTINHFAALFVEDYFQAHHILDYLDRYLATTDSTILNHMESVLKDSEHPLHFSSRALRFEKERFFSFRITQRIDFVRLKASFQELGIPREEMILQINDHKAQNPIDRLWVVLDTGAIVKADQLIQLSFPGGDDGWGAVHPRWKSAILALLAQCEKEDAYVSSVE